jgi:hypothetical protein
MIKLNYVKKNYINKAFIPEAENYEKNSIMISN